MGEGLGAAQEMESRADALLKITVYDDVAVASFTKSGAIDASSVEQLAQELDDLVEKRRMTKIVVDLAGVAFLSSSALGQFYSLYKKKLKPLGGGLGFCNFSDDISQIWRWGGEPHWVAFDIVYATNVEEAVRRLRAKTTPYPCEQLPVGEGALLKVARLKVARHQDIAVVSFTKSEVIDDSHVEQLAEELDDLVEKREMTKIVVDFEGVSFLSSSALGQVLKLHKKVDAANGGLRVCGIPKYQPFAPPRPFVCESVSEAISQLRKLSKSGRAGCLVFVCLVFVVVAVMLLFCA